MPQSPTHRKTSLRDEIASGLAAVEARLEAVDALTLVGALTLVLLLLYPGGTPELQVPLRGLCVAGLLYRPLMHWPWFWGGVTAVLAVSYVGAWAEADNHKFLFAYWSLALTLATAGANAVDVLRTNARWLIGLCFAVAVTWKLRTPDFWQGAFLHFSFLADVRFSAAAQLVGGIDAASLAENRKVILPDLIAWDGAKTSAQFHTTPRLATVSTALAYWTVLIETCIAAAFLWPVDRGPSPWRDLPLLVFIVSTYAVAHVGGFAWILVILGLAQASRSLPYRRLVYLTALGLVILYELNLPRLLLNVL